MVVNTRRLFTRLLPALRIDAVCDVGSMNGADALRFRDALPRSSIYALEPNPHNYRRMQADRALAERDIRLAPLAATNYDGEAEFFLVAADYARDDDWCGMSSLYRRPQQFGGVAATERVRTTRLDSFLADKCPPQARLALWIDTEGNAYEALEGAAGVCARVQLLHVEVETQPCISAAQKFYPQVRSLLERLGFTQLATDQPLRQAQFNALFVRRDLPVRMRWRVQGWLVHARLRYWAVRALLRVCPSCARRYDSRAARR
jgi:FkbM family methyltransferase